MPPRHPPGAPRRQYAGARRHARVLSQPALARRRYKADRPGRGTACSPRARYRSRRRAAAPPASVRVGSRRSPPNAGHKTYRSADRLTCHRQDLARHRQMGRASRRAACEAAPQSAPDRAVPAAGRTCAHRHRGSGDTRCSDTDCPRDRRRSAVDLAGCRPRYDGCRWRTATSRSRGYRIRIANHDNQPGPAAPDAAAARRIRADPPP